MANARLTAGQPQRQVAAELGLARSTLQAWRKPVAQGAAPVVLAAWVETPEGVQWLHQLVLAAHFCITLQGGAGIRVVCQFLELSGLSAFVGASYGAHQPERAVSPVQSKKSAFVGASYGAHQGLNAALEEAVVAIASEQRAALGQHMAHRQITVCEDETFPPQVCLVAREPVSGFVLLEPYAANRQAATWTQALRAALVGLNVTVIQGTGDEATALCRPVEVEWAAHRSPDLFHGQYEVSKATSLSLARQVRQAAATVVAAQAVVAAQRATRQAYEEQSPRPRGRPPAFTTRIDAALSDLAQAETAHIQAQARQGEARELVRELGILYHPYDLEHGQAQSVEQVAQRLNDVWTRLRRIASDAQLPARARERLAKAQRLTTQLLATIPFFFTTLQWQVEALALPSPLERALVEQLIPALYLERLASRSTHAEPRHRLRKLSQQLLEPLRHGAHPIHA